MEARSIKVINFAAPQLYHRLTVRRGTERHSEKVSGPATYTCQLQVFRDAVTNGGPVATASSAGHGIVGMRERVALYAGEFSAGPLDGGGFRVLATLPYGPS